MNMVFDEVDHFHPNFDESEPNRAAQWSKVDDQPKPQCVERVEEMPS